MFDIDIIPISFGRSCLNDNIKMLVCDSRIETSYLINAIWKCICFKDDHGFEFVKHRYLSQISFFTKTFFSSGCIPNEKIISDIIKLFELNYFRKYFEIINIKITR